MTTMDSSSFPWAMKYVEPELTAELSKYFKNHQKNYLRVGPKGYFVPGTFMDRAASIYNLPIRSSDIFVTGYPRSGSTWTRELVWTVANDFVKSDSELLDGRFHFLEGNGPLKDVDQSDIFAKDGWRLVNDCPSPRFIGSHLPLSLLPRTLLDTGKVIYVARDPRDVVVSYYHLNRLFKILGYEGDLKTFWKLFISNSIYWTPFFEHLKESWQMRHHSNMLFLFYEDMSRNLPAAIRKVARFLNKSYTEEQVTHLSEHLQFDKFKKNKLVNFEHDKHSALIKSGEQPFIRKGKVGGWRDYFDEEMTKEAEQWMADNLQDTDLRFPDIHSRYS